MRGYIFILISVVIFSCSSQNEEKKTTTIPDHSEIKDTLNYAFYGRDLCSSSGGHLLNTDTMLLYGRNVPYHVEMVDTNGKTWVKFEAIFDCCLEPYGSVKIVNDTAVLDWGVSGKGPCDCWCDYEFNYLLPKDSYNPEMIVIK